MNETPTIRDADRPHCLSRGSRVCDEVRAMKGDILLITALGSSLLTSLMLQRPWVAAVGTVLVITGTLGIGLFFAIWFCRSFRQVTSSAPSTKPSRAIGAAVLLAALFVSTMGGFVLIDERTASSPQAWSLFAMIAGLAALGVAFFAIKLRRLADADGSQSR